MRMHLPRVAERCIVCLRAPPFPEGHFFTEEHVIPRALGGVLTWNALCKPCNDKFGHTFESRARTDPAIRVAIYNLRYKLPRLFAKIEEGQPYLLKSGKKKLPGVFRDDKVSALTRKVDGDLWASPKDTEGSVRTRLRRSGLAPMEIEAALARYRSAPDDAPVDLGGGFSAASRPTYVLGPDLTGGESLAPLTSLKIAYEFAVLSFGAVMLDDHPPLNEIRRALLMGDGDSSTFRVEALTTTDRKAEPFHGIAFEGNKPHAVVQVRLFGLLAYRVHLRNLAIDSKPFGYRHDIDTGQESCAYRDG